MNEVDISRSLEQLNDKVDGIALLLMKLTELLALESEEETPPPGSVDLEGNSSPTAAERKPNTSLG